jgi:hypothetical protein
VRKRSRTEGLERWSKSNEFRQIARRSAKANLATFHKAPRCGAVRKRDGAPCCNPAMKNGRCGIHGGKTPSGRQWHVVQYPDCSTPAGEAKFNRKLRDRARILRKRAARLAAMTPEQRARHDAWHRSHAPGGGGPRSAERVQRRQSAEIRLLLAREASPSTIDPELVRLEAKIAALKTERAQLQGSGQVATVAKGGIFA